MVEAIVPGLEDDVLGDGAGGSDVSGELDIFPHDEGLVDLRAEVGDGPVYPVLVEIAHGLSRVEPGEAEGAEVVAVGKEFVATNVEPVVREDGRDLLINLSSHFVSLVVENVKLAGVGLHGGVLWPVVVGPPAVLASQDRLIDLLPARACVTRHVNFRNDANATGSCVADELFQDVLGIDLILRVSILSHVGIGRDLNGPGLVVNHVPVEDVKLRESHAINLFLDLLLGQVISARINHDTADGEERLVFD